MGRERRPLTPQERSLLNQILMTGASEEEAFEILMSYLQVTAPSNIRVLELLVDEPDRPREGS